MTGGTVYGRISKENYSRKLIGVQSGRQSRIRTFFVREKLQGRNRIWSPGKRHPAFPRLRPLFGEGVLFRAGRKKEKKITE